MRKATRLFVILLIFILLFGNSILLHAAENDKKVVKVACGMNEVLYLNAKGEPDGIGLPYLRQLAWNENWTIKYVEGSYNESLQKLYDGEIDLMFPVGKEEDPNGELAFSETNIGYQQIGLFAKKDADIFYDDYKGFNQKKVGLSLGSNSDILDHYAKEKGFTYEKVSLNTKQDKIDALNAGTVDMIAFSTLNTVPDGKLVAILDQLPVYICTSVKNQTMIDEINNAIREVMVQTPEIATELYQAILTGKNPLSYTREENRKIQSADRITFGVYGDRLPLAGIDKEGNCVGIYVDLLHEIAKYSGLTIDVVPIEDGNQLYHYIDNGTVDFVIGIQELRFSQENADNHLSSNHLTECSTVAITKSDYDLDNSRTQNIVLTKDRTYLEAIIHEWFPNAAIKYLDTRRECLDAVTRGSADVTLLNMWEYNYETKNLRYSDLIEWESYRFNSGITLGGSRQSDLELLSILEKTIGTIPVTKITDIITTNLNNEYQTYTIADRIYAVRKIILIAGVFCTMLLVSLIFYIRVKKNYIRSLEEANKAKTEFLSRMSHELRTPLNAISGYTTVVEDSIGESMVQQYALQESFTSIHRAVDYQLSIIGDLLDIQQLEAGKLKLHNTEVAYESYINNIVQMVKVEADEKKIDFRFENSSDIHETYLMDGIRFQQVLLNLLHNAIKFTNEGGRVVFTVERISREDKTDQIRFTVSDTGIGMSEEFQKNKLFQRFAQEYAGNTSPYEGCGTGLEISYSIIHMMHGEITCQSEKGVGTVFYVTIPVEKELKKKRQNSKEYCKPDLTGYRILLCEDNKMNQDMESRLLRRMHCEIDVADDGEIGLRKFIESEEGYYDLILMDIRMPNMDGWECTRRIRLLERKDAKSIPIFAVSANAFEEDIRQSGEAGLNEHLSKPVDVRVLYEKAKEYCKK